MEEGMQQEVNKQTKKIDIKKFIPIIGGVVAVVILLLVVVSIFGGGPKKVVKKYVSGMNSKNPKKVVKAVDPIGQLAWGWEFNVKDFEEEDYEEFIESYEEYEEEMGDDLEDRLDDMIDSMEDEFDDMGDDYKSYKIKIEEFKKVEKLGKDLYAVKAKVSMQAKPKDKDDDEIDESETITFVVYKNKIISGGI